MIPDALQQAQRAPPSFPFRGASPTATERCAHKGRVCPISPPNMTAPCESDRRSDSQGAKNSASVGGINTLCSRRLVLLRSLINQVEELVKFRSDDDFGASVALATEIGSIVSNGVVLSATTGGQARGVDTKLILKHLHD